VVDKAMRRKRYQDKEEIERIRISVDSKGKAICDD